MVNQRMLGLGTARSVIRELFEYGKIRAAQVGAENVFDFSLGNPSVPCTPVGVRRFYACFSGHFRRRRMGTISSGR